MRPKWSDLTKEQQSAFGNGIGPDWAPDFIRNFITKTMSFFFNEASWRHHDFGYTIGKSVAEKFEYDYKFLRAMIKDSLKQQGLTTQIFCVNISLVFYIAVTLFGWFSFNFSDHYKLVTHK